MLSIHQTTDRGAAGRCLAVKSTIAIPAIYAVA